MDCTIPKVDDVTARNTCTLKTSLQLILHCLGISTIARELELFASTRNFGMIDHLTRWSLHLTEVTLQN